MWTHLLKLQVIAPKMRSSQGPPSEGQHLREEEEREEHYTTHVYTAREVSGPPREEIQEGCMQEEDCVNLSRSASEKRGFMLGKLPRGSANSDSKQRSSNS